MRIIWSELSVSLLFSWGGDYRRSSLPFQFAVSFHIGHCSSASFSSQELSFNSGCPCPPGTAASACLPTLLAEKLGSAFPAPSGPDLKLAVFFSLEASGSKPLSPSSCFSSGGSGLLVCVSLFQYPEKKSQHVCGWVEEAVLQSQPGEK